MTSRRMECNSPSSESVGDILSCTYMLDMWGTPKGRLLTKFEVEDSRVLFSFLGTDDPRYQIEELRGGRAYLRLGDVAMMVRMFEQTNKLTAVRDFFAREHPVLWRSHCSAVKPICWPSQCSALHPMLWQSLSDSYAFAIEGKLVVCRDSFVLEHAIF